MRQIRVLVNAFYEGVGLGQGGVTKIYRQIQVLVKVALLISQKM